MIRIDNESDKLFLSSLSENSRSEILRRYRIIEPYLNRVKKLKSISIEEKISFRTVQNWVRKYRKKGLIGLSRNKRSDEGKKRVCNEELQIVIEGIHLRDSHLSIASIHRRIKEFTNSKNIKCPSYKTVSNIIKNMPHGLITLAHDGLKVYKDKFDLLYIREAKLSNEIWQADHMLLDILLKSNENKKENRPWLTIIIDEYSRGISGYDLSFMAPSAKKTSLALRQGIWRKKESEWSICGIPSILYTDHGSDFTSNHIEQVCIDLKIELIFSSIGIPRGRGKIERFFRSLNQLLLSELEGFTRSKNPTPSLTLSELEVLVHNFILKYNQTKLEVIENETPKQRWEKNGFLPRLPESLEQLDLLLFTTVKPRKIGRDGIKFQGLRYLDPLLADYVGEDVIIRFDQNDLTSIRVFYKNKYLCQPICLSLDKEAVSLKEIQIARNSKRRDLQNEIKNKISLVDAILNLKQKKIIIENNKNKIEKRTKLKLYESE